MPFILRSPLAVITAITWITRVRPNCKRILMEFEMEWTPRADDRTLPGGEVVGAETGADLCHRGARAGDRDSQEVKDAAARLAQHLIGEMDGIEVADE